MKVLVVTDIRLYREGVAEALRRFPDVEEAVTAAATVMWSWSTCRSPTVPIPYGRWSLRGQALKGVALGVLDDDPGVAAYAEVGVCECFTGGHGRRARGRRCARTI